MNPLLTLLERALDERSAGAAANTADPKAWFETARAADSTEVPVLLPQLPRRLGRQPLGGERTTVEGCDVDLSAWRVCDAAAAILLATAGAEMLLDLFAHGDYEERAMVMRARTVRPIDDATVALLGEAQRTNTQDHVEALVLDCDLVARAVDAGAFPLDDFHRLMLKIAFVDLPAARMFGVLRHANQTLSTMLQDLATEREAATRKVWYDTCRFIGRAPAAGSVGRLLGALEHGDDNHRLAAAEGLGALARTELTPFLRERLNREPHPTVRAALENALASTPDA